jgi:hypothetical protein
MEVTARWSCFGLPPSLSRSWRCFSDTASLRGSPRAPQDAADALPIVGRSRPGRRLLFRFPWLVASLMAAVNDRARSGSHPLASSAGAFRLGAPAHFGCPWRQEAAFAADPSAAGARGIRVPGAVGRARFHAVHPRGRAHRAVLIGNPIRLASGMNRVMLMPMVEVLILLGITLTSLFRSRVRLEAEILVLRQQINVLRRNFPKRAVFRTFDRLVFVALYRLTPTIVDALAIVRPETVVRWHRAGFRSFWRWKSRRHGGRPSVPFKFRKLIGT